MRTIRKDRKHQSLLRSSHKEAQWEGSHHIFHDHRCEAGDVETGLNFCDGECYQSSFRTKPERWDLNEFLYVLWSFCSQAITCQNNRLQVACRGCRFASEGFPCDLMASSQCAIVHSSIALSRVEIVQSVLSLSLPSTKIQFRIWENWIFLPGGEFLICTELCLGEMANHLVWSKVLSHWNIFSHCWRLKLNILILKWSPLFVPLGSVSLRLPCHLSSYFWGGILMQWEQEHLCITW